MKAKQLIKVLSTIAMLYFSHAALGEVTVSGLDSRDYGDSATFYFDPSFSIPLELPQVDVGNMAFQCSGRPFINEPNALVCDVDITQQQGFSMSVEVNNCNIDYLGTSKRSEAFVAMALLLGPQFKSTFVDFNNLLKKEQFKIYCVFFNSGEF